MLLKRLYDHSGPDAPKVRGVKVMRAGKRQNFSADLVAAAIAQGWMSMSGNELVLSGENVELTYKVERGPGYYVCFDNAQVPDGAAAREHIKAKFKGKKSPDPANPAGYRRIHHYECVLAKEVKRG